MVARLSYILHDSSISRDPHLITHAGAVLHAAESGRFSFALATDDLNRLGSGPMLAHMPWMACLLAADF